MIIGAGLVSRLQFSDGNIGKQPGDEAIHFLASISPVKDIYSHIVVYERFIKYCLGVHMLFKLTIVHESCLRDVGQIMLS